LKASSTLLERRRVDGPGIAVAQHLQVQLLAADIGQHGLEQDVLLPRLAAVRQTDQACGLELISAANSSSGVAGSLTMPAFLNAALEYQIQVDMWMSTGTA
jgi:hypothetical protein